jgi:hypothetical protein
MAHSTACRGGFGCKRPVKLAFNADVIRLSG